MDPLAPRVVERFVQATTTPPKALEAAVEFLRHSKMHEVVMGMAQEAKKDKVQFGHRDATEAIEHWIAGREDKKPAQVAAARYIASDKGKKLLHDISNGVADVLKKNMRLVGFRDVGAALMAFMKGE